jgi:hypothetical protein
MMMLADFRTAQPRKETLGPISASLTVRIGFAVIDALGYIDQYLMMHPLQS